jgi:hypothetical protein
MNNDLALRGAAGARIGVNELTIGLFGAAVLLFGAVLWSADGPSVEKTDFTLSYVGAKIVHDGMGSRLYDINFQKQVRDAIFRHPNPLLFEHPPFEAALLSPLAAVPFRWAYMLWGFINATICLAVMLMMRRYLPSPIEDLGYVTLWLVFAPLGVALYQGQSSLILLALYAGSFALLEGGNEMAAGAALGFGLFKFQFVLPFALIFLLRKKWRYLAGFACTAAVLLLLSLAIVGRQGMLGYVNLLLAISKNPRNLTYGSATDMPTINGFVYAMIGRRMSPSVLTLIVAGLSLAMLVWIARRWQSETSPNRAVYAAAIAGSLLSGSHMFTHDFSPLALALFIAAAGIHDAANRSWRVVMLCSLIVFWLPPVYFVLVCAHLLYLMCPVLFLFAVSLVLSTERYGGLTRSAARQVASA